MAFTQDAVVVEPKSNHKASIIWLHGLGADGHDFEPIVPELGLSIDTGIKFIFPNAPVRPVTINGGVAMRAWYDVRKTNLREFEDEKSIVESTVLINHYIEKEVANGIPSEKIIIAGFSQGGAIALHCGTRYCDTLAGIVALSTYLPLPQNLDAEKSAANSDTSIFMAHGIYDLIIPVDQGKSSAATLKESGYDIQFIEYTMEHAVCMEEITAIGKWITERLA